MQKGHYIGIKQSAEILNLIEEFQQETNFGEKKTYKSDKIFSQLLNNYLEKLILGVIYSPKWRYYTYGEIEDLQEVGRMHLYKCIIEGKFDKTRGTSLFAFLTAVISNNLRTYTTLKNKWNHKLSDAELENVTFMSSMQYEDMNVAENDSMENLEKEIFKEIEIFFKNDDKFLKLANNLKTYIQTRKGKKFLKKEFIEYVKAVTGYSPSLINSFLANLKKIKKIKTMIAENLEINSKKERFKK